VRVQQQRAAYAAPARDRNDVRSPRRHLLHADIQVAAVQPLGDEAGDLAFPGSARDQRRVERLDRDEPLDQTCELGLHAGIFAERLL
jgi:hypothetical protein